MIIRNETDLDIEAILEVTASAFEKLELSSHTEQFIIKALRVADALTVSLVAEVSRLKSFLRCLSVMKSPGVRLFFTKPLGLKPDWANLIGARKLRSCGSPARTQNPGCPRLLSWQPGLDAPDRKSFIAW